MSRNVFENNSYECDAEGCKKVLNTADDLIMFANVGENSQTILCGECACLMLIRRDYGRDEIERIHDEKQDAERYAREFDGDTD